MPFWLWIMELIILSLKPRDQSPDLIKFSKKNFTHRCLSSFLFKHINRGHPMTSLDNRFLSNVLQSLLTFSQYSHQCTYIYWIILCIPKGNTVYIGLQPYNYRCACLQKSFHWMDKYYCLQNKLYIKCSEAWADF